jgi:hypothetical protein
MQRAGWGPVGQHERPSSALFRPHMISRVWSNRFIVTSRPRAVSKGFSSTANEEAEKKKGKIRIKKSKSNTEKVGLDFHG